MERSGDSWAGMGRQMQGGPREMPTSCLKQCCPIQQPVATCGSWTLEMQQVKIEMYFKHKMHNQVEDFKWKQ